ncbi:hypothetical protein GLOTRDRAFT_141659 [Gloeophyllum trabeum ATCC 11539]|uniref:Thioester reductase (TE) domain-containing protein n=1 Tax=Gloeophyllum trabeum (strain ATCC 11539 / FP-39264 / Madison 617) TaxID=670483 RepID=S7PQZ6_GLOTA|nr:uncharacterized protein GLOTRDRAFT_141659 [Gloeophyllum trabeum ATCC 11539]EPQ49802.1 hypothetical protein GLOTRDRAFT_141659 [Gloeophyllum trabeum ATCC 11539]
MKLLADKYSAQFPAHSPSVRVPNAEAVLVTGTTGRLGCHILATLLAQSSVARVFALNRKDARTQRGLEARQKIALEDQGLSPELVHHEKLSLLEGDVVSSQFGLDGAIFKAMQESVTCIIHNAWRVDFNVSLSSMEPMVAGTRNLLDFALSSKFTSPPKFLFVSSLSVYRNWTRGPAPEEPIPDPVIAQGSGYSESKWVGEKILLKAAETTPLSPSIVRVGQISGGKNGAWSTVEWFPSLVRAGEVVGCLPIVAGHVSWLPADVAGASLVEMRRSSAPILHLAHPKPVPWSTVLKPLSEKMGVPLVPYSDWLAKLEATISSHAHVAVAQATGNPALRNMDFFRGAEKTSTDRELEAMGFPRLVVEVAKREAPSLQKVTALGADDVDRWLSYWRAVGFLQKEH